MREDLSFLTSIDEYEKPDVQGTNGEADERADGCEQDRTEYAGKFVATPAAQDQSGRAENGGDDVVQFTHGERRGKLGLALQGGGFS